ncbi:MAG: filamentous hemagglutinin N-terminal domain-containing protein [Candidatus Competibacterales bacterium]
MTATVAAQGQTITLDGTFGTSGPLATDNGVTAIPAEVGRQMGGNLFHSFQTFGIPENQTAVFLGDGSIDAVVGRVTGGEPSFIDGTLSVAIEGADLFLANPAGVMVGPNAQLDTTGSLHLTTAEIIRFGDGSEWFTRGGQTDGVLSTENVAAFGFIAPREVNITVAGQLVGAPGETLSLVGNDVTIAGGAVVAPTLSDPNAPAGRVDIAAIQQGEIDLASFTPQNATGGNVVIADEGVVSVREGGFLRVRGNNFIVDNATVDASVAQRDGGNVSLNLDDRIELGNNGRILTFTDGPGRGTDLDITGRFLFIGISSDPNLDPGINAQVLPGASGDGGDITIAVEEMLVDENKVRLTTFGSGTGGTIVINADQITFETFRWFDPFDYLAGIDATSNGPGDTGRIEITTVDINLINDSGFNTDTRGSGNSRGFTVNASGTFFADGGEGAHPDVLTGGMATSTFGTGNGGRGEIRAQEIILLRGSGIITGAVDVTAGEVDVGDGGEIFIQAERIVMDGQGIPALTGLTAPNFGPGDGGSVTVVAGTLELKANAGIATDSGQGATGDVTIDADSILIDGAGGRTVDSVGNPVSTSISTSTLPGSLSPGGKLTIRTGDLTVRNGGGVTNSVFGDGSAGTLNIEADYVRVEDGGFIATATGGPSNGGNLQLNADRVDVMGGGIIRVDAGPAIPSPFIPGGNLGGGEPPPPDFPFGNAGSLFITTDELNLAPSSTLLAEAINSGGGNIAIQADNTLVDRGSAISASSNSGVAQGGNVTISSETLVAFADARITARADQGQGGNIVLAAEVFILEDGVTLDASSNVLGNAGQVEINSPELDISEEFTSLTSEFVAIENLGDGCRATATESTFVVNKQGNAGIQSAFQLSQLPDISSVATNLQPLRVDPQGVAAARQPSPPRLEVGKEFDCHSAGNNA